MPSKGKGYDARRKSEFIEDFDLAKPKVYRNENASVTAPSTDVGNETVKLQQEMRAKRFGIVEKRRTEPITNRISKPVTTFDDVDIQSLKLPPCTAADKGVPRLNSILVFGADTMSTKDVFEYFREVPPDSLEWVDDMSCVVVWSSENEASTVLDTFSRSLKFFVKVDPDEDSSPSEDSEMDFDEEEGKQSMRKKIKKRQPSTALAFGTFGSDVWRIGLPTSSHNQVYLRQATEMDKKVVGAANRSLYYLKFGKNGELSQPGSQGIISTSRKRRATQQKAKILEQKKEILSDDQEQMDIDDERPDVNPIKLYTTFSKGEKRLKMYSDEDDKPVFQRLTCENSARIDDTDLPKVIPGDLREKLRQKSLQNSM